ncbi:hypothetical protein M8N43_21265, partial [Enterobacter asburiae]|nr:hypothetical protein [Enterobacter asburiae]
IGPDPRNFNQRVSLGRNDLLIRTFPNPAGPGRLPLFFVTFTAGIIVAAEKYQPFVLVPLRDVKTEIVNK